MNEKEKVEVFGTWVFADDEAHYMGIVPYVLYTTSVDFAIEMLNEDYHIEKMGVVTLVEDLFEL